MQLIVKKCCACKQAKPLDAFHKNKSKPDGLATQCKPCTRVYNKKYRDQNLESIRASDRAYYQLNKEERKEYNQNYYRLNAEEICKSVAEYAQEHPEVAANASRRWRKKNKLKERKRLRKYQADNPHKMLARKTKYRASQLQATPPWLTSQDRTDIEDFFLAARMFRIYTGQEYHVDHVVPLQGKTVCGLHVPWNLAVIEEVENKTKSNRHWPDMWEKL